MLLENPCTPTVCDVIGPNLAHIYSGKPWDRRQVVTNFCTKTGGPFIFMAIYGIPEIFLDDNNQYEYPSPKKYQKM